jgi:hypothetical protein
MLIFTLTGFGGRTAQQPRPGFTRDFEYFIYGGEIIITKYIGNDVTVEIPSEIAGLPVTEIGGRAFENNGSVVRVSIPQGVFEIGERAFANCVNLTLVMLPDGLEIISTDAFLNCRNLAVLYIPHTVKHIEQGAFYGTPWYGGLSDGEKDEFLNYDEIYQTALNNLNNGEFVTAREIFLSLVNYRDSAEMAAETLRQRRAAGITVSPLAALDSLPVLAPANLSLTLEPEALFNEFVRFQLAYDAYESTADWYEAKELYEDFDEFLSEFADIFGEHSGEEFYDIFRPVSMSPCGYKMLGYLHFDGYMLSVVDFSEQTIRFLAPAPGTRIEFMDNAYGTLLWGRFEGLGVVWSANGDYIAFSFPGRVLGMHMMTNLNILLADVKEGMIRNVTYAPRDNRFFLDDFYGAPLRAVFCPFDDVLYYQVFRDLYFGNLYDELYDLLGTLKDGEFWEYAEYLYEHVYDESINDVVRHLYAGFYDGINVDFFTFYGIIMAEYEAQNILYRYDITTGEKTIAALPSGIQSDDGSPRLWHTGDGITQSYGYRSIDDGRGIVFRPFGAIPSTYYRTGDVLTHRSGVLIDVKGENSIYMFDLTVQRPSGSEPLPFFRRYFSGQYFALLNRYEEGFEHVLVIDGRTAPDYKLVEFNLSKVMEAVIDAGEDEEINLPPEYEFLLHDGVLFPTNAALSPCGLYVLISTQDRVTREFTLYLYDTTSERLELVDVEPCEEWFLYYNTPLNVNAPRGLYWTSPNRILLATFNNKYRVYEWVVN